ncbi:arginine deiminase type-3 [Phaeosphaeriaceae sp. PMI808]|nr:arginine deiminase type-3 [Phaeosphaeriaceae sp. PMI808]
MRTEALITLAGLCMYSAMAFATASAALLDDKLKADIRADTDRDGKVDITGSSDSNAKTTWTADSGAIFLPNIGDTGKRCSNALLKGPPVSNEKLDICNDASDNILRSEQFLAPLRTVPIAQLPDDARGRVYIKDQVQRKNVRIFHKTKANSTWAYIDNNYSFNAASLREGLVLGVDGRDVRRPNGGWDGRVMVSFDVQSSEGSSSDEVMLRAAPVLTHTHLDPVEQVLAVKANKTSSPWLLNFNNQLQKAVNDSGFEKKIYQFSGSDDVWAQDFVEPGFASMPGPNGPIMIRIMIRSPQDERVAGRQLFEYYRDTGIGAVQQLGGARDEINSGGNIETIPPYEFNGTSWPAGRLILGNHGEQKHFMLPFFQAQETQNPLLLDTNWLVIGHVDEFLQFIPVDSPRGWVLVADDPMAGVEMLQKLKDNGHGKDRVFSRKNDTTTFPNCNDPQGCAAIPIESTTIDEILANKDLMSVQERCAERIEANLQTIMEATGITEEEIVRLPSMFKNNPFSGFFPGGNSTDSTFPPNGSNPSLPAGNSTGADDEPQLKVGALFPGVINGIVMTGFDTYIAPNPWGPVVNGTDVLAEELKARYAEVNMTVVFIDDWNTHHNFGGEIHCGTNTARNMETEWY